MQLSIVIVNWNTRDMLHDCLASVYGTLGGIKAEVLVVDNASEDGSREMVEARFPDAKLIANVENRGFAAANNQAFGAARGDYILLLNSDTIVHGDVLARSIDYMDAHGQVGAMGCRVLNTDGSLQPTCSRFPTLLNLILLTSGLWKLPWLQFFDRYQMRRWQRLDEREVDVVSGCYLMARAQAVKEVGPLDESFFFYGEETDWCRRFQKAGWRLRFAPVGEITHHGGGSVRRLNHERDLLLSQGLVRLHRKHNGVAAAAAVWLLLLVFNSTRSAYWTLRALMSSDRTAAERRSHFLAVVRGFARAWPGETAKAD